MIVSNKLFPFPSRFFGMYVVGLVDGRKSVAGQAIKVGSKDI